MKTVSFLVALVSAVALASLVAGLCQRLTWYGTAGLFYGTLALAELVYLSMAFALARPGLQLDQERRANTGVAE